MVYTRFHHPVAKDKIITGNNEQYENSMSSVSDFKKFILETYEELESYTDEELAAIGMRPNENGKDGGNFEVRVDGAILHLGIWRYMMGLKVHATQWGILDNEITRLTGGAISAGMRVLDFEAADFVVGRQTSEHQFSFGFEDTGIDRKPVGTYLEACLPHPTGKIAYNEEKGKYDVSYKTNEEKPKASYDGSVYVEYHNEDGTPYKSEPFVCTTYASFDDAIEDVERKTEVFQNVWNNVLTMLRENRKENGSGPRKR